MTEKRQHWVLLFFLLLSCLGVVAQDLVPDSTVLDIPVEEILLQEADSLLPDSIVIDTLATGEVLPYEETLAPDSVKKPASPIEAPIHYKSLDSMVMVLDGHNMVYLFGDAKVDYQQLTLTGEYVEIDADSSIVYSTFGLDSIGDEFGYPIFKDGETEYEMKKARYNFKTKKMFINDVITQQGEGFLVAGKTKKTETDDLFMEGGRYTTCDEHDHPHFYFQTTKLKVRPKKNVISGPAYLVLEDVPLPIAVPFAFFPLKTEYSSGIIMPSFNDELRRGFSLNDGGYYFAINDYVDVSLTGEIYTKGSWGLNVASTYKKRYKYTGNLRANYIVTVLGEKESGDYSKQTDIKVTWSHSQDSKAHPFRTFSASVNFSTSSYDKNSLNSLYSGNYDNTKTSSISYSYKIPDSPVSFSLNASLSQTMRDSTLSVTLPNMTINTQEMYPFKRKNQVGATRWYENIRIRYTGQLSNSIRSKENEFMDKSLVKDWRNGMKHTIPVSASFTAFKHINITPSFNYEEKWYTSQVRKGYDYTTKQTFNTDTVYGFNRVYNFSASLGISTKLYGFYKPWKMFGKWAENTQIRHVVSPSVSFSASPDFSDPKYGFYRELEYYDADAEEFSTTYYSLYDHQIWGGASRGKSGTMSFSLDNNLEMKVPMAESDSTRKISLIDNLRFSTSYNFMADSMNWSNFNVNLRLKFGKAYTLNLNMIFDPYTYTYDETRNRVVKLNTMRWEGGKGIARLMSTGTSFSYTLNNSVVKGWFNKEGKDGDNSGAETPPGSEHDHDHDMDHEEGEEAPGPRTSLRAKKSDDANRDKDGYWLTDVPWNLSFNFSANLAYNTADFNREKREYAYKIIPTAGISGSITPTKNWSFNFSTNYDFEYKKFTTMNCSISRQMHCWVMSASVIPIGPYQSYNFSIAVKASMLKDLKYTQSSSSYDAKSWGFR